MTREITRSSRRIARRMSFGAVLVLAALMGAGIAEAASTHGKSGGGGQGVGGNGGSENYGAVILPGQPGNCSSFTVACVKPPLQRTVDRSGCSERRTHDGSTRRFCHRVD